MSTRAATIIHSEWDDETPICAIYKHWDGYPDCFGLYLREIVSRYRIVNGIPLGEHQRPIANGMGCLAALIVQCLKDGPGDVYLCPVDQREEYNYHVRCKDGEAVVTCDEEPDW